MPKGRKKHFNSKEIYLRPFLENARIKDPIAVDSSVKRALELQEDSGKNKYNPEAVRIESIVKPEKMDFLPRGFANSIMQDRNLIAENERLNQAQMKNLNQQLSTDHNLISKLNQEINKQNETKYSIMKDNQEPWIQTNDFLKSDSKKKYNKYVGNTTDFITRDKAL